ncbi:hypothetical protein DY000_02006863 [Brassica cretica]|uniref:Uncharacterized protein n=1 Tax=Brassica cretica TaxID=69181 RepID=A0ABQ7BUT3_BRACR|nr:hypothetical protein DY000_02006863 [Brassica cretica]
MAMFQSGAWPRKETSNQVSPESIRVRDAKNMWSRVSSGSTEPADLNLAPHCSSIPVESLFRTASHDINENCGFWMMRTKVCSYHLQVSIAHGFLMHPLLGVEQSSWQLSSPVGDSCDIF